MLNWTFDVISSKQTWLARRARRKDFRGSKERNVLTEATNESDLNKVNAIVKSTKKTRSRFKREEETQMTETQSPQRKRSRNDAAPNNFQVVQDSSETIQLQNHQFQIVANSSSEKSTKNSTMSPAQQRYESAVPPSSLPILELKPVSSGYIKPSVPSLGRTLPNRFIPTRPTIIIYATVQPETVIIPIVCSIVIFPLFVLASILLLKHYNEKRRAKDRFRAGFQHGTSTLFTMGKIGATSRAATKPTGNQKNFLSAAPLNNFLGMPELELETVFEMERNGSESSSSIHHNGEKTKSKAPAPSEVALEVPKAPSRPPETESISQNHVTLKTGCSSLNCDIVVTVEPPPHVDLVKESDPQEVEVEEEVVVVLEDDDDMAEYRETAL